MDIKMPLETRERSGNNGKCSSVQDCVAQRTGRMQPDSDSFRFFRITSHHITSPPPLLGQALCECHVCSVGSADFAYSDRALLQHSMHERNCSTVCMIVRLRGMHATGVPRLAAVAIVPHSHCIYSLNTQFVRVSDQYGFLIL